MENEEQQYTLTLNKKQLELISQASEFMSRFCCGQITQNFWPLQASKDYWKSTGEEFDEWCKKRNEIDKHLEEIKKIWWGLSKGGSYGLSYDEDCDALFDIYQVVRHQLWKDKDGVKSKSTVNAFPATKLSKEKLIEIEKV